MSHGQDALSGQNEFIFPAVKPLYDKPLVLTEGQGVRVRDIDGREYLDLFAGILTTSVGHCNPKVIARMGEAYARRVFMSSRKFSAKEAERFGLLASVVPVEGLDAAIMAEVVPYLSCAPGAVAAAKALARTLGPKIDSETIEMTVLALMDQWETKDAERGIASFFAKTTPPWMGADQ